MTITRLCEWVLVALVILGAMPMLVGSVQLLLVGLHRYRSHLDKVEDYTPRVAVLVPAWNEAAVLALTVDRLMLLDYPRDRLRVYVVDDASTDNTGEVLAAKRAEYPGALFHLRREQGGQGKAHTLNHGLDAVLKDDWTQAVLIMDADVVFTALSLRRMARHLADPEVGAVTAYIKEGSEHQNGIRKAISFEYDVSQAGARRAQNVLGAVACLAGGAQLHSRENLEAIGCAIDTSTLAEDTVTTLLTQLDGRRVIFEPNAIVWAEEPETIDGLWKQRLRWARGNVQVTRKFEKVWFRRSKVHGLGDVLFGLLWFTTLMLPLFMLASSLALVILWLVQSDLAFHTFDGLWIVNGLSFVFLIVFSLLIDPAIARGTWRRALMFPGLISVTIVLATCFPRSSGGSAMGSRTPDGRSITSASGSCCCCSTCGSRCACSPPMRW